MIERAAIRPAHPDDAPAIARVVARSWRAAYRGILPADRLTLHSRENAVRLWRSRATSPFTLVAVDGGQVVGVAHGSAGRRGQAGFAGILDYLYVDPDQQGRGHGALLLRSFAAALARRDVRSMMLWCLGRNAGGRRFYERHGGQAFTVEWEVMGTTPVEKVAYGWRDLSVLSRGAPQT